MLGGHCHLRGQGSVHGPGPPACLGAGVFAEVQVTCPHQRGRPWGPGVSARDLAATWKQSPGPRLEDLGARGSGLRDRGSGLGTRGSAAQALARAADGWGPTPRARPFAVPPQYFKGYRRVREQKDQVRP